MHRSISDFHVDEISKQLAKESKYLNSVLSNEELENVNRYHII